MSENKDDQHPLHLLYDRKEQAKRNIEEKVSLFFFNFEIEIQRSN